MTLRAVIVHERFTEVGGSERVVEQLVRTFPGSRVFAPVADPAGRPAGVDSVSVSTSRLQHLYPGNGRYAHLLPLLPFAMARADLREADVVIASHHAFANRVRPPEDVPVVSYVHTPARWIWDPGTRTGEAGWLGAGALRAFAATQRAADRRAAARVHTVVANSTSVAARIARWWRRESVVVHPPVRTHWFTPDRRPEREDFVLLAGRLVPYKRPEVAVLAARESGVRLVVAGDGRSRATCERMADPSTVFLGRIPDDQMRDLMRSCRALVFPGEEDFGIVPVEAMSCATPVIALAAGGALDTVVDGATGVLVRPADGDRASHVAAFAQALAALDESAFDRSAVRAHAERFGEARFREHMRDIVASVR